MALPPKGDVTRPIYLAARSMLVLGIINILISTCLVVGTFGMFAAAASAPTRGGAGGPPSTGQFLMVAGIFLFALTVLYIAVGVTFIVCSVKIKQGKRWAVTTGIVLASITLAFTVLGLVGTAIGVATGNDNGAGIVQVIIYALFVAAFAQLIVHLKQSYVGIERLAYGAQRGFDVVMPTAQPYNPQQFPPRQM